MNIDEKKELAKIIATSSIIPKELRGKPSDIFVLLDLAESINEPYWKVMNGVGVAMGRLVIKAEFQIGRAMESGLFKGPFLYEEKEEKDNIRVRVKAVCSATGETIHGPWVDLALAKAEGWTRNSKYQNKPMARHMLRLRSATFFIRLHCPQTTFGGITLEEAHDVGQTETPPLDIISEKAKAKVKAKAKKPVNAVAENAKA
jgi:hypothetical protein